MSNKVYPWLSKTWDELLRWRQGLPQALLVHGPAGIGKLELAEAFAQLLLCESKEATRAACGRCDGCRWFEVGSHPDFRRLEPELLARQRVSAHADEDAAPAGSKTQKPSAEIRIDQIRELDGFLNLQSHRGGRRVALVHPAEAMNQNSANALLKALEEPQPEALFILVADRPARLLPTIRSRCVALAVTPPEAAVAGAWLEAEGTAGWKEWLAFAGGSPLGARDYAAGSGELVRKLRQALAARDLEVLGAMNDREQLEALAEVLQKHALDVAFNTLGGRPRFGAGSRSGDPFAWLRYARAMGRNRRLASHPLNPRLFAGEMLAAMPKD